MTLTGPGGIGKTRLAISTAEAMRGDVDGVCFVDLAAISDVALVGPTVARAVGVRETDDQALPERLAAFFGNERLLMVLDNFEQIVVAGLFVAELLATCRHLIVLVTSRVPLRITGEQEFPVPPLAQPETGGAHLADVRTSAAGRLFLDRAWAVDPAFTLNETSAPAVAAICAHLEGLPLAIELAAAHTKVLRPQALLARLDRRLPLLVEGPRDQPARLQTMRDAIGWSYNLLDAQQKYLFRQLAIFTGGFTLDAAEAVIGDADIDVLSSLKTLIDHSLIPPSAPGTMPRFAMLEIVREYALEQLRAEGEEAQARAAHAAYFLALAEYHARERYVPAEEGVIERFEADHANFRLALAWLEGHGDACRRILTDGGGVALVLGRPQPFPRGPGLARAGAGSPRRNGRRGPARCPDGTRALHLFSGDDQRAERLYREALGRYQALEHAVGAAYASTSLGALLTFQEKYDEGGELHHQALGFCRQIQDAAVVTSIASSARSKLGMVLHAQGDAAAAVAHFAAAIDGYRSLGYSSGLVRVLYLAGCTAMTLGDLLAALAYFRESVQEATALGDERILAVSLEGMAAMAAAGDRLRQAALLFGAAAAMRDRIGFQVRYPLDLAIYATAIAQVRGGLDDAALGADLDEGRHLALNDVLNVAADVTAPAARPAMAASDEHGLSRRELEVLRGIVARQTDREIADELSISPRTVGWHVTGILNKLGVDSRRDAARKAVQEGII